MKPSYQLLDSGNGKKLELVGGYKLIRSSPLSLYKPTLPKEWESPSATYHKNESGSGHWEFHTNIPESFLIEFEKMQFKTKLTPFGHIGLFPEQATNWRKIQSLRKEAKNKSVLNLFAYSGASTIACAKTGYSVCHVDASKGMVDWARENAKANGLSEHPIRWIVEDVQKFIKREIKRGKTYQGFLLDPPTFGRGSKGEVWKIEDDLLPLLEDLMILCDFKPDFVVLSCHSQGFGPEALRRILSSLIQRKGKWDLGELTIQEKSGNLFPAGSSVFFEGT